MRIGSFGEVRRRGRAYGPLPIIGGGGAGGLRPQDVFATTLYTGNGDGSGTPRVLTTGIDLTSGGTFWPKRRDQAGGHALFSASRGFNKSLESDNTSGEVDRAGQSDANKELLGFSPNSVVLGGDQISGRANFSGWSYVAWSVKKAAKFYTEVVYTGDGTTGRQIAHDLGIPPGLIAIKRLDTAGSAWCVYHRSLSDPVNGYLLLNTTAAEASATNIYAAAPTSAVFSIGASGGVNTAGGVYEARLWAHDPDTTNGLIQCGSGTVALPRPPQWVLYKDAGATGNWTIIDSTRGFTLGLNPNLTNAEATASGASVSGSTITFTGMTTPIWCAIYAPF